MGRSWDLDVVTLESHSTPVAQIISEVSRQLGLSYIIPDGLDLMVMSVSYNSASGERVIDDIASYLKSVPEIDGDVLRFVPNDEAVLDFLVLRSGYKTSENLVRDLESLLGPDARVRAVDDRVVVSGTPRELEQVKRFERHLQTGPDGWRLNVRVVGVTDTFRRDLGLDWNVSASLSLSADYANTIGSSSFLVDMVASATETQTEAVLYYSATMYILEGSTSVINQGRQIPVPRYQTSPEGTTTVVGYDFIDAGFNLQATAQRVPIGVMLNLQPTISTVVGFVQDAPITEESSVRADVILEDQQWVVITGLTTEQASSDYKGIPGITRHLGSESRYSDKTSLLVMVQAQRILGDR